ncbi:MAG: BamA/TamA family outer membrane protein [Limnothrix sp. RL_2_0]|nr:BamA/TamA family outer membrane protein [Limnothrix sp. RL_2_0]
MIWRFFVNRSFQASVALKRCLVGVLLLTAMGSLEHNSAVAVTRDLRFSGEQWESLDEAIASTVDHSQDGRTLVDLTIQGELPADPIVATAANESYSLNEIAPQQGLVRPELIEHKPALLTSVSPAPIAANEADNLTVGNAVVLEKVVSPAPEIAVTAPTLELQPTQSTLIVQNPNSNTEPLPIVEPLPLDETETPIETPSPTSPDTNPEPDNGDRQIVADQVQITGSTVFDADDFEPILAKLSAPTNAQLQQAADKITQLYLQDGFITSRAVVVQDSLNSDTIEIRVIEGQVKTINLRGNERISDDYLRSRLELGSKSPLNTSRLEDQLRLLKLNPIIENIEAILKAGEGEGQSDLDITITEANTFSLNLGTDNYSPASVGSERITLDLAEQNLTGAGDRLGLGYIRTTRGGAESLDLNYTLPINAKDGTISLRGVLSRNEVIQEPFDVLNIRGESERYELTYRQPILRNPREEFALGVGFSYQSGLTFLGDEKFGFNIGTENGESTTSVVKFTQDYTKRQPTGAWSLRSQFSIGTGLFNATTNDAPIPDGHFWSWLGQAQRVKLLNPNNLLIIQADVQLTPDSLLPSQQFVIGGGPSLRGFRQNARSADNGIRFSVEDRITLARDEAGEAVFQVAPFFDAGTVWNSDNNPNQLPSQKFLAGVGVGTWWQIEKGLTLRLDYAIPLVDLQDRGENFQDKALYFNVNYLF